MKYHVLWLDDELSGSLGNSLRQKALENNLIVHSKSNAEEGCEALRNTPYFFDAVILDGSFFQNRSSANDSFSAFNRVMAEINDLKTNNQGLSLPVFVFSGRTDFLNEYQSRYKDQVEHFFSKGEEVGIGANRKLVEKIFMTMTTSDRAKINWIKKKYPKLMECFDDDGIFFDSFKEPFSSLTDILFVLESNDSSFGDQKNAMLKIRHLYEQMFESLISINYLPNWNINGEGNKQLNKADMSKILCSKHPDFELLSKYECPSYISLNLTDSFLVVNAAAHTDGIPNNRKETLDDYFQEVQTDYFFRATCYKAFDVLVYYNKRWRDKRNNAVDEEAYY